MSDEREVPDWETQEDPGKKELEKKLKELELSAAYWLTKLQRDLAISNDQALQYTNHEDYQKLEKYVQHPWEIQALKRLLNIPDGNSIHEERCALLQKRQEKAKTILKELQQIQADGKKNHNDVITRKKEELRKTMDIPTKHWLPTDNRLQDVIENIHKELTVMENSIATTCTDLSDAEVLRNASGGLALEGIYKTSKLEDFLQKREHIITVPKEFHLYGAEQSPVFEQKEFSSFSAESMFTKSMEMFGYTLSCSAKSSFWGFQLDDSTDHSKSTESESTQKPHTEESYICTTKYNYIPLASCYFQMDKLRLSSLAVQELKSIDQLLSLTDKGGRQVLDTKVDKFFHQFGSHVNLGPLHFGGIFWWKASVEGFKTEHLDEIRKLTMDSLNIYVGECYSGISLNEHLESFFHGAQKETLQKQIHRCVTKTGGPVEIDSPTQWKCGLVCNNKTWCVIDRGFQLVPVWELILRNHKRDFKDTNRLCSTLLNAYKTVTGQNSTILSGDLLLGAVDEARMFLNGMKSWQASDAEKKLKKLNDFKQKLNEKVTNDSVWTEICLSDPVLQDFLIRIVEKYRVSPAQETIVIKSLMQSLVEPHIYTVEEFPKYLVIMKWIYESQKEQHQTISICEFSQFKEVLQRAKEDIMQCMYDPKSTAETVHESKVKATLNISLSLFSFLKSMRNTKQVEKEMLFLSIANSIGYCVQSYAFRYVLGWPEMDFMIKEMEKANIEYMNLWDHNPIQAQAFLVLTVLTITSECKEVSLKQKEERLNFILHHMACVLFKEIELILKNHDKCCDWKNLEKKLNLLRVANCGENLDGLKSEQVSKDLQRVFQGVTQVSDSTHVPRKGEIIVQQNFLTVIKRLDLQKYFPKRMKISDFRIINQSSISETPPTTERELPFYFLQKLLTLDYRARYTVCKDEGKRGPNANEPINKTDISNESNDTLDDFLSNCHNGNADVITEKTSVHPMDLQMAVFHCADDFMRQYLYTKLSFCQFSLPLLVPDPCKPHLDFPLWCFRQVTRKWKPKKKWDDNSETNKCIEKNISEVRTPLVSFIRFGNSPSSKSQILNNLLNKQKHNIFFHRHCKGSNNDCQLMDGVVDIAWYCPGGKDDDCFDECIAFTNLHGDARDHKKQVTFLDEIATVNVILMSDTDLDEKGKDILREFLQSTKPLICLLADKGNFGDNKPGKNIKIGIRNRNEAELVSELTTTIEYLLKTSNNTCSLEECERIAHKHGFQVDEHVEECKEAKALAQTLISVLKEKNISVMKETFLSLQGELWHNWCKKDKELRRLQDKMNKSIEQQKSDIESEKHHIRQKQLDKAFPLNELLGSLIEILQSSSPSKRNYVLQWFKMYMDGLSYDQMSMLYQKYHVLWSTILSEKKKENAMELVEKLQHDLNKLSTEMNDSTFGLEHLLREIGQIYEALDVLPKKNKTFYLLPHIAANLMASGYPIELMDGDAAHVPLKWIDAVLEKLIEELGDQKLFVLSVLGIQSTGKSTLLNAMFGLQFAVSAGRCTRGAFMQLVKVDEKLRSELNFDYVLVIDTEGLRATELAKKATYNHDNELATFVIGLGNMTLINIFGENPCEMQDILQIAVQAFLRMKKVKLSPSCLFVHQNVGEITAKEKNMEGRRRLQENLDEMTLIAAEQERCDVTCFNDVIRFDVNTHSHYFSHLWEGDGPMAPPNPSYSQNVRDLKSAILMTAKGYSQGRLLRISDLKLRINDLWSALLNENFVFSFRNSLEIAIFNRLEMMYSSWTWQLREHLLDLQNRLKNQIENDIIQNVDRIYIDGQITKKYDSIMENAEMFFKEDKDCEMLIQWKANTEKRLQTVKNDLIDNTIKMARELLRLKSSRQKLEQIKSDYETQLLTNNKKKAKEFRGQELSEEEQYAHFARLMNKWITEAASTAPPPERPDVFADMESILLEQFKHEHNLVDRIRDSAKLTNFTKAFSDNISKKTKWFGLKSEYLGKSEEEQISKETECLKNKVIRYIEVKEKQKEDYLPIYFHNILKSIEEQIGKMTFRFKSEYKLDVSLYLCQMAAKRFKVMSELFQKANDPRQHLESKRQQFFHSFKIFCEGTRSIATFADLLCDKLKVAIHKGVYDETAIRIAGEMTSDCEAFNGNRSKLEKEILISLAEEENFENYMTYIEDPETLFFQFITKSVKRYCFDTKKTKLSDLIKIQLDSFQNHILTSIDMFTMVVKDRDGDVSYWLDEFCRNIADKVKLPRSNFRDVDQHDVKDIDFLKEAMTKALHIVITSLQQETVKMDLEPIIYKVREILCGNFPGCWVQCPFCKATCTNTRPGHDGDHSVQFHRPQGLAGVSWENNDNISVEICTTLVSSNVMFFLKDDTACPYRSYRKAGPEYACWSITPDTSAQSYWKWFVCHFRLDLEKYFGKKFSGRGEIPSQWHYINKETAIEELKQTAVYKY